MAIAALPNNTIEPSEEANINGIKYSIKRNSVLNETQAPFGLRCFRWVAQTSQTTKDWYSLAKTVRDALDGVCEAARHYNISSGISFAGSCHWLCAQTTKATIIPYLLGSVDSLVFKGIKGWAEAGKKMLNVTLAVNLVARVTLGITAFSTPLNVVLLIHYSVDLATQGYRWYQMRLVKQAFDQDPQRYTPWTDITSDEFATAINQEHTLQHFRVVDAVVSLAAEVFSQMYPAMKLVNATVGGLTSVYSMSITCYHEMQVQWHFKLS